MPENATPSFAEIAVELRIANVDFAEVTVALWLQAQCGAYRQGHLEALAARIGLSPAIAERILMGEYRHTEAIAHAHLVFKKLIPHEATVLRLIEPAEVIPFRGIVGR